jgi:hypothetical protein
MKDFFAVLAKEQTKEMGFTCNRRGPVLDRREMNQTRRLKALE